ncbi:carotenoid oxygenase family protein [Nostoc sp. LEGE 06077]|uniref:carotenoid oxygenase family protein n=1 Tax=Nostoc sp. LEGE 06077 TaxID=915325 RepID=UPI001881EA59|nr:carotenoid oxygenase family protein [Nostoc sp. LEGE 06077]MBE9210297.1 carotenoid oxygenase family protein [Nostoc sp. LEGE 06077]
MQNLTNQQTPTIQKSYTREDWQGAYQSITQEYDYWIDDIEGQIPPELQGTLFRNGPGLLDVNGQRIHHPIDGDGMISRITFTDGRAHFRNRFVQTEDYLAEQKAGKILYRGAFGTQKPGGWLANIFDLKIKNPANTSVIYWGEKLLALWEGKEPYLLDPYTLETLGKEYFHGFLSEGQPFSAHPRIDPSSYQDGGAPCLVNFSSNPGLSTKISIFELDQTGKALRNQDYIIPGFCFIHDFVITPNYYIFFQNPVTFNPILFGLGISSAAESIKFQPNKPTRILVIPRNPQTGQQNIQVLETQAGFIFHHANAFEVEKEVFIDTICYDNFPELEPASDFRQVDFEQFPPGNIWRFHLNLDSQTVQRKLITQKSCEFPSVNPHQVGRYYRYLYISAAHAETGNAPPQAILKLDLETGEKQLWSDAPRGFVGEPIFVPRPGAEKEDDGWILTLVYDAAHHRSDVVILDASDLSKGAIARLHLKHHIPYGFHGNFTSEVFCPIDP